jgi:hypothetical protein
MQIKNFLSLILLLLTIHLYSQTNNDRKVTNDIFNLLSEPSYNSGRVNVVQDDRIKVLVNRYIEYRRKDGRLPGYRIRIFSDSGTSARQTAWNERSRFVSLFPEIPTYLEYEAPNFKIYVGDFRTKIEGFVAYKQIGKNFRSAFLVPARINLPKL